MNFSTSIDGQGVNALNNWVLQVLAAPPAAPALGRFYFDSAVNAPRGGLRIQTSTGLLTVPFGEVGVVNDVSTAYDGTAPLRYGNNLINARASSAVRLDAPHNFSITGKATAPAVSFNGTAEVALNVSALGVVAGDIALANGLVLTGSVGGVAQAVARTAIPLSDWGAAIAAVNMGNNLITLAADPVSPQDVVNLRYLQANAAGLNPKASVKYATTAALPAHFVFAVGVIQASAVGALVLDGVTPAVNDRVLIKDEAVGPPQVQQGVYDVKIVGDTGTAWQLQRSADADTSQEIQPGSYFFVTLGNLMRNTGWVQSSPKPFVLNTDPCLFNQFSGGAVYVPGNGIVISGNTIHFAQAGAYTARSVPFASSASVMSFAPPGTDGFALVQGAGGPSFSPLDLSAAAFTGILPAPGGGTGRATLAAHAVVLGNGAGQVGLVVPGATGQPLLSTGASGDPVFGPVNLGGAGVTGIVTIPNGGTGLAGIATNAVLYGQPTAAMGVTNAPLPGDTLIANASGVPSFQTMAGDATMSGSGTLTIRPNVVTFAKMQQVAGLSVAGNPAAGTGNLSAITAAADNTWLRRSGSTLVFAALTYGDITGPVPRVATYDVQGNGSATAFIIPHNRNTRDVSVFVYRNLAPWDQVIPDVAITSTTTLTLTFTPAPANGENYRCVVVSNQQ